MTVPMKIIHSGAYPRAVNEAEKNFLFLGLKSNADNGSLIYVRDEDRDSVVCSVNRQDLEDQVASLVVVGKCQCGDPECHTVQFQHYKPGCSSKIVEMIFSDGRTMTIFINRETGLLSGLQVIRE